MEGALLYKVKNPKECSCQILRLLYDNITGGLTVQVLITLAFHRKNTLRPVGQHAALRIKTNTTDPWTGSFMGYKVEDAEAWSKTDVTHTQKPKTRSCKLPNTTRHPKS